LELGISGSFNNPLSNEAFEDAHGLHATAAAAARRVRLGGNRCSRGWLLIAILVILLDVYIMRVLVLQN
jgi:hypothetical protein